MQTVSINNKDIYIVKSHNQVLEAWEPGEKQNLFSLDFHTDTRNAFYNYAYWRAHSEVNAGKVPDHKVRKNELMEEKIRLYRNNRMTLEQVNDNLKHDEHLDFAVRTEMIDTAFILANNTNKTSSNPNVHIVNSKEEYDNHRLIEYSLSSADSVETGDQGREQMAHRAIESEVLEEAFSVAESYRETFFDRFILDIDCDYFNTEQSLYPENRESFEKLIRDSEFITIALEPECVDICRYEGHDLDSRKILKRLLAIIEQV